MSCEVINGITDEVYGVAELRCEAWHVAGRHVQVDRVEVRGDTFVVFVEHELEA